MTIRRDLDELETLGVARRMRDGAIALGPTRGNSAISTTSGRSMPGARPILTGGAEEPRTGSLVGPRRVGAAQGFVYDTILAVSVLHVFTEEMEQARRDVSSGGDPSIHPAWGIQDPGLALGDEWQDDHAMRSLRHFWGTSPTSRRSPPSPKTP